MDFKAQMASEWYAWHDARVAELAKPFGWLSVTAIQWFHVGQSDRFGGLPGVFSFDGEWMRFTVDEGQTVGPTASALETIKAGPESNAHAQQSANTFTARVDVDASLNWLVFGHLMVELLNRDGHVALRLRDSKAPLLSRFVDVPTFPLSTEWVTTGHFEPYPEPVARRIASATPGLNVTEQFAGTITFDLAGHTYTVVASGYPTGGLHINFHDYTNGTTTPAWRTLSVGVPDRNGLVVVDFNRTVVYPMSFTPYATCPAPVPENFLSIELEAGERKPAQTLSENGINTPILLIQTGGGVFYEASVALLHDHGIDVDMVDAAGGETLPPLTGYSALVTVGYNTADTHGVSDAVVELIGDAVGASIPVVAIGNAATALGALTSPGWQSSMESGGFSVGSFDDNQNVKAGPVYEVTVSDDIARDQLFSKFVKFDETGVCYIPVRELATALRDEQASAEAGAGVAAKPGVGGPQWSTSAAWQDLLERFARLVHTQI